MTGRVVVTGTRDGIGWRKVWDALDRIHARGMITRLAHGACRGVDTEARGWAENRGVLAVPFPADWKTLRRSAGPIRNGRMLREFAPDVVLKFPGAVGTADCVAQARAMGIPIMDALTGEMIP